MRTSRSRVPAAVNDDASFDDVPFPNMAWIGDVQAEVVLDAAIAGEDVTDLPDVLAALEMGRLRRDELDDAQARLVAVAVAAGVSWADLGRLLGVSRQAVQQRYGRG